MIRRFLKKAPRLSRIATPEDQASTVDSVLAELKGRIEKANVSSRLVW